MMRGTRKPTPEIAAGTAESTERVTTTPVSLPRRDPCIANAQRVSGGGPCQQEWKAPPLGIKFDGDILVSCFKDGLNDDLYHACIIRGVPACLHDWCILAEEAEINQAQSQYRSSRVWKWSSLEKMRETPSPTQLPASNAEKRVTGQWSAR